MFSTHGHLVAFPVVGSALNLLGGGGVDRARCESTFGDFLGF
jgi:hypothetical protein